MNSHVDRSTIRPTTEMRGEDDAETSELQVMLETARSYVTSFGWCDGIEEEFFGLGIGGIVGVFLFRIRPVGAIDEWLWVIAGDLPSAYLVTDRAASPTEALEVYCELMEDWIRVVRRGGDLRDAFPVLAEPNPTNADLLERRVVFLRNRIITPGGR
ncbi:hypothetical protein [Polyangium jinanense]|uniref:Uncharacterized protein n=1 Tax=Polyangium jinanense TaxID=2829994 RepID=A0A9X3X4E3_9BACT|nr:hypothetical protein [Polyangium jinanense]MDC3961311.1 hypothetical protein [Polyangium jinanense]MDC3984057.1 hypothetical protein [Polyangium jinanense]